MSGNNVLNRDNFIALYNGSSPRYNVSQFGKRIQASLSEVHYSENALIKILLISLSRDLHGVNRVRLQ